MKLKEMKKKLQHNPTISIVPYLPKRAREIRKPDPNHAKQAKTEPKKTENPYCPATHTSKCTNILVPTRHSTQRRLTYPDIYVTRLARKFPRAQHTQLRKTEHETLSIHTQITEITMNKGKRKLSPVKHSTQQRILNTKTPAK